MLMISFTRLVVKCLISFGIRLWKCLAWLGYLNVVKDKVIYPRFGANRALNYVTFEQSLGHEILKRLENNLERNGDFECLINGQFSTQGGTLTCGKKAKLLSEVVSDVKIFAKAFLKAGLKKGNVFHIVLPNCTEFHAIVFAAWKCQAIVSLADPGMTTSALVSQLIDTKSNFIVCSHDSRKKVYEALQKLELIGSVQVFVLKKACPEPDKDNPILEPGFRFLDDLITENIENEPENEAIKQPDDEVCLILWSSGTTGTPKGIQITIQAMKAVLGQVKDSGLRIIGISTTCFFHVGGFLSPFGIMRSKSTWIFNHGPDLDQGDTCEHLYKQIDKFKPFYAMFGSHHLVLMSKNGPKDSNFDLGSLMLALPMGSTVPNSLYEDLKPSFPNLICVFHLYGMSEVPAVAISYTFDSRYGLGMIGPSMALKIVNPDTNEVCGPNEVGEIMVKSPILMGGYLNRPEENEKFFAQDGFIHTGDLGSYISNGQINYEGRLKELIKYKNHHVYPLQIENVIRKHPDVIDVGVFGLPEPSVQELISAIVVKRPNSSLTESDVQDLVKRDLEEVKQLRGGVKFAELLPKNPQGKLLRRKLNDFFTELES